MKIAVWHNLPSGGGKRALYDQVQGLVARGHSVEAWCPPSADQTYLPLSRLISEHVVPMQRYSKTARNPLTRLQVLYRLTVSKLQAFQQHCQRCADVINRGGFDVVLAHSSMDYAVAPIARYSLIPTVIYLQEPYRMLYEATPVLPWVAPTVPPGAWHTPRQVKNLLFDFLATQWLRIQAREELLSAQAFDLILVNSLFSRESVLRAYGLDARVCYLGIDTRQFVYRRQPREGFVIGVGAITPRKNVRLVIESIAQLHEPRPTLVWIGNTVAPTYLDELKALAQSGGVRFESRTRIDDATLIDLLNRASVMAYAPRLEPFGYAPLEANACGLPVVAVAEGGVRETIVDGVNGCLVEPDPQSMAAAIERLMCDTTTARRLGENGHQLAVEKWPLSSAIDRLESRLVAASAIRPTLKRLTLDKTDYWKTWQD